MEATTVEETRVEVNSAPEPTRIEKAAEAIELAAPEAEEAAPAAEEAAHDAVAGSGSLSVEMRLLRPRLATSSQR